MSRPPVGAVHAVELTLSDGVGALDHLAAVPLQILLRPSGDLPAAALGIHISQSVLQAVAVLIQRGLPVGLARQGHGIRQVPDSGAAVFHGNIHHLTAGIQRQPHSADHRRIPAVPAEVGDAVINKLVDCLRNIGEATADGLPEVLRIRSIVQFKLFFIHRNHIYTYPFG